MRKQCYVNRLVIIGNGFDLAHGYKTTYNDFVNMTNSIAVKNFRKYTQKHLRSNSCWYEFENTIKTISRKAFSDRVLTDNANIKIAKINILFRQVKYDLLNYLSKETNKEHNLSSNVKYWLTNSFIINFNYTNTVERYNHIPFYIHGKTHDRYAVLGYDYRVEQCNYCMQETYYSKKLQRDILEFSRFLASHSIYHEQMDKYISRYEEIEAEIESSRGHLEYTSTNYDNIIKRFRSERKKCAIIPGINYSNIQQLVIMGHSLKSDCHLLNRLFRKCKNIKDIYLFIYNREPYQSVKEKVEFLKRYCESIKLVHY